MPGQGGNGAETMDLAFTESEQAFRAEVRDFLRDHLPDDLRRKMVERRHLTKEDIVRWQRILNARGWATPSWPVVHGGQDWTPARRYIFQEEMALGRAPETLPFNVNILCSLQDPKILRRDDAEVVGYGIAVDVPLSRHLLAQERQHRLTEISERLVTSIVGDVLVHQSP